MQTNKKRKGSQKNKGGVLDTPDSLFKVINHGDNRNPMQQTWKKQNFYDVPIIDVLDSEIVDLINYYRRLIARNPDRARELRALFSNQKNMLINEARNTVNRETRGDERVHLLGQIAHYENLLRPINLLRLL
jgi:hypothetical protein